MRQASAEVRGSRDLAVYDTGMLRLPTLDAARLLGPAPIGPAPIGPAPTGTSPAGAAQAPAGTLRDGAEDGTAAAGGSGFEADAGLDALGAAIAGHLAEDGACWIADWPPSPLRARLREDLLRLQSSAGLAEAAVGRGGGRFARQEIRGDRTCWLDDPRCGPAAAEFLAVLDQIRAAINRRAFLGLAEFEAHYAAYPPGAGYARHRDRFRDSDARVVSWVTYLNPEWREEDGGALRLYADDGQGGERTLERLPVGGSVCFLSEIEHEVRPAHRPRHSIAGWMRRRAHDLP